MTEHKQNTINNTIETPEPGCHVVIFGYGELGKGFKKICDEMGAHSYVVSVSGRDYKDLEKTYTRDKGFPVSIDEIDAVLLCCRTDQLNRILKIIPKEYHEKIIDRCISFQNGLNLRQRILQIFGKSIPRCVPKLSFKSISGNNITLTFAGPSPLKPNYKPGIKKFMNMVNGWHDDGLVFEKTDSILTHWEGELKGGMNAIINTISVIYKSTTKEAYNKFITEYGQNGYDQLIDEISTIVSEYSASTTFPIAKTSYQDELKTLVSTVIDKFGEEYPSTYQQVYTHYAERGDIHTDNQYLIGRLDARLPKNLQHSSQPFLVSQLHDRVKNIIKEQKSRIKK